MFAVMDAAASPLERAIRIAGSESKLAEATGYSQVAINKAKRRGSVSPQMALAVHRFTGGAVPASALRPDLWARPQDVPIIDAPIIDAPIRDVPVPLAARASRRRAP
jgi:DNA-binding transcriptional regulator YdaS (Cro superfamily)